MVETVIAVISGLFGLAGVYLGLKSRNKLSKLESQLEKKKELSEMAELLEEISNSMETAHDSLNNPWSWEDLHNDLRGLARSITAYYHESNEEAVVDLTLSSGYGEDAVVYEDTEHILENYKDEYPYLHAYPPKTEGSDWNFLYSLGYSFRFLASCLDSIDELEEQYEDEISEFDRQVIDDSRTLIENIVENISKNVLENEGSVNINPDEYGRVEDISISIYHECLFYEGIESDLDELSELVDRIEKLRLQIVQASYS